MKKYLISLEKDIKRRELFFSQEGTADFEIFTAINTLEKNKNELEYCFDCNKFYQIYGRQVTKGEIGCTLSHLTVYQKIAEDNMIDDQTYCLICEDDALFQHHFDESLSNLILSSPSSDIILLGQSKIKNFDDVELEVNYPTTLKCLSNNIQHTSFSLVYPYKNYFAGTVAYLIKKSAVSTILARQNHQRPYWLADDFILYGSTFHLDIQYIRPLMVIENPNIQSNLENNRGSTPHSLLKKLLKYPVKKLLAIKRNIGKKNVNDF